MSSTTPNRGYPYPQSTDSPPDIPYWIQALAIAVDADVDASLITGVDRQIFTVGGTWTKPAGAKLVHVQLVGGGGGGAGAASTVSGQSACGGGGGGGEYGEGWWAASVLGATETVTVGAAGAAATAGANNGGNGGTSSFGVWITALGGSGGAGMGSTANLTASGGSGGSGGAGGDLHVPGESGDTGRVLTGIPICVTRGGASQLGQGAAQAGASHNAPGTAGRLYGGGGGGGLNHDTTGTPSVAGGAGAAGIVIVTTSY